MAGELTPTADLADGVNLPSNDPSDTFGLQRLTKEQLAHDPRELQPQLRTPSEVGSERLQRAVPELQVQQVALEMQNRALQDVRQELEDSLRRHADLFDHLPIGYIMVSEAGEIGCANPAALELLRAAREDVVGGSLGKFLDAYDAGRFAAHVEACARSGRPAALELTLRLRDGSVASVQLSSRTPPRREGQEAQVHIAITDVTDLKRTQRTLEEINREQDAFSYSISHDLRAPLVTISNYARIVLSDHGEQLGEEARDMLRRIENASLRMEETLKHLLEYNTLARDELVVQPVNMNAVVRDLLIEHRALVHETAAQVSVEPELPVVRASPAIMNQVLSNLLTNALKYTAPGVAPRVHISGTAGERTAVLRVADEGIGIESKHHDRIFRIFERLHGYSRYPGSGIGLAIARRAVERMDGRIWVESSPGKGSCFYLELPKG